MVGRGCLLVPWVRSPRGPGAPSVETGVASVLLVIFFPLTLLPGFDV